MLVGLSSSDHNTVFGSLSLLSDLAIEIELNK